VSKEMDMENDKLERMEVPYYQIPNEIHELGLKCIEISVYCYLARCANNGKTAFPSLDTISEKAGTSKTSVQRAIKKLENMGLIFKNNRCNHENGAYKSNTYVVNVNIDNTSSQRDHRVCSERPLGIVRETNYKELGYKELEYKEINLPPQDGVAEKDYIYFEDLETNDYIKQVNNYISDRKKITKDNYNNAVDAIDDIIEIVEISGLNDMIKWYKQEKLENRSVENFILYKERFYREYDYEMEG
jgi:predicted transcriptional regulator